MKSLGIKAKLGPKLWAQIQIGGIDEIIEINREVENTQLVVDWGHLHALHQGSFKTVDDMRKVASKIEQELGTQTMRSMHCHFSKIEFGASGEKCHHTLDEAAYGPEFGMLAEVILEFGMHPTLICETPILDVDARKMKETLEQVRAQKQK
jgi:deoxyribonuclease-4